MHPSLLSKDEELRDIGHSISFRNLILGLNSVTVSYLILYGSLLQNATAILLQNATEVYYKIRQKFITKCVRFLLQNVTVVIQNEIVITNCDDFIAKFDRYYKMRRLLQIAAV